MQNEDLLDSIISVSTLSFEGRMSVYSLVRETGYFERYNEVTESDILARLKSNPRALRDWWQIADDSRAGGWRMFKSDEDYFHVAFVDDNGEHLFNSTFSDEASACAHYIKMKLEYLRKLD